MIAWRFITSLATDMSTPTNGTGNLVDEFEESFLVSAYMNFILSFSASNQYNESLF